MVTPLCFRTWREWKGRKEQTGGYFRPGKVLKWFEWGMRYNGGLCSQNLHSFHLPEWFSKIGLYNIKCTYRMVASVLACAPISREASVNFFVRRAWVGSVDPSGRGPSTSCNLHPVPVARRCLAHSHPHSQPVPAVLWPLAIDHTVCILSLKDSAQAQASRSRFKVCCTPPHHPRWTLS